MFKVELSATMHYGKVWLFKVKHPSSFSEEEREEGGRQAQLIHLRLLNKPPMCNSLLEALSPVCTIYKVYDSKQNLKIDNF